MCKEVSMSHCLPKNNKLFNISVVLMHFWRKMDYHLRDYYYLFISDFVNKKINIH